MRLRRLLHRLLRVAGLGILRRGGLCSARKLLELRLLGCELLPALLRAGALRFWISRLWDYHLPREASMLKAHDPGHFERVLRQRVSQPVATSTLIA